MMASRNACVLIIANNDDLDVGIARKGVVLNAFVTQKFYFTYHLVIVQ